MKSIALVLIVLISFGGFAQDSLKSKKIGLIVKTDVFIAPFFIIQKLGGDKSTGYFASLSLEKTIRKRHSIQLTGNYAWNPNYREEVRRINIIPEYKFFIMKYKTCYGPFVGTYFKFQRGEEFFRDEMAPMYNEDFYFYTFSLGIITGYQYYILKDKIEMDFLIGYGRTNEVSTTGIYSDHSWYDDFRIAFNIGYKF